MVSDVTLAPRCGRPERELAPARCRFPAPGARRRSVCRRAGGQFCAAALARACPRPRKARWNTSASDPGIARRTRSTGRNDARYSAAPRRRTRPVRPAVRHVQAPEGPQRRGDERRQVRREHGEQAGQVVAVPVARHVALGEPGRSAAQPGEEGAPGRAAAARARRDRRHPMRCRPGISILIGSLAADPGQQRPRDAGLSPRRRTAGIPASPCSPRRDGRG